MYRRPNSDQILAAPAQTGGLKGIIAGKITFVKSLRPQILLSIRGVRRSGYRNLAGQVP